MLRQVKPRNARSKRALAAKEPKAIENPKTCLFLRGTSCSQVAQDAINDLYSLRVPLVKRFTKKNDIHPFEDPSSLEFFAEKNDTSLIVFGSTSKKRPHTLTYARTFSAKILDMLELHVLPDTYRSVDQFRGKKPAVGMRPMLNFSGTAWDAPVEDEYTMFKSLMTDFFKGETSDAVDVEGLQYVVSFAAEEEDAAAMAETTDVASSKKPIIHMRAYTIRTKRSGGRLPRVEVDEMGPRMDFRVGRMRQPDEAMLKEAMRKAKTTEERTKKNISTDTMGDKMGRVHLGRQDLSQLQTRKMKGLKRSRDVADADVADVVGEDDNDAAASGEKPKKSRKD